MNWKKFVLCGLTGWCMEILFTSFGALLRGDTRLLGRTSVWMFPIYGMAALISPVYDKIRHWPILLRGLLYGAAIMVGEFLSGSVLRFFHVCPWDYSDSFLNIKGLVPRLLSLMGTCRPCLRTDSLSARQQAAVVMRG